MGEREMESGKSVRALWIVALAVAFAPSWLALARAWLAHDYQSHGFFVPVVAWWMARADLAALRAADPRPSVWGWVALVPATLAYALGLLLADATVLGLALVAALAALVLQRFGAAGLRRLAFPLAFLLFMVPIPTALLTPVVTQLQLSVSGWAVDLLHAAGYSVLQEGNVVLLPGDERLFVSEACSGITSIVTLLPLGVVLAHFTQPAGWRRWLLVSLVVPAAMLGNLLRVIGTVVGARAYGVPVVTAGPVHDLAGVLTFLLACGLVIAAGLLLRARAGETARPAPARG
jgi:exosortase